MEEHSDAFVFFGATGDLAYKEIFPALQVLIQQGHLDVPIIGVAKSGWSLDRLKLAQKTPAWWLRSRSAAISHPRRRWTARYMNTFRRARSSESIII